MATRRVVAGLSRIYHNTLSSPCRIIGGMELQIKIWEKREQAGISLTELSRRTNISISALWNYENGKRDPGIRTLEKIAKALNTSISSLYDSDYK